MQNPTLISFSGGRSSALALRLMTINGIKPLNYVLFANTGKERDETLDFVHEVETQWNIPVVWIEGVYTPYDLTKETMINSISFRVVNYDTAKRRSDSDTPYEEMVKWINCGIVPNRISRFCTKYLKIIPMTLYMEALGHPVFEKVMGIRYDEPERILRHSDSILPLVNARITQQHVRDFWSKQLFDLKLKDYEGNCDLCQLKSRRKRLTILKENPEFASWWIRMENMTNSVFEQGWPVEKLLKVAQSGRFKSIQDQWQLNQSAPTLFGQDLDVSCFCGD